MKNQIKCIDFNALNLNYKRLVNSIQAIIMKMKTHKILFDKKNDIIFTFTMK